MTTKFSQTQGCQLNEVLINEHIFNNFACWKCYETYKLNKKLVKVNCRVQLNDENYTVPGFVVEDECVPFDHRTKSISKIVQSSLTSSSFERWRRCCNEAVECCNIMIRNYQAENFFSTCDNHWDGMRCYLDTLPGVTVQMTCPHQMTSFDDSKCTREFSFLIW